MDFKISCLLFIRNEEDDILMLCRKKSPNKGRWSPPGGKLDMVKGESPYQCARREALEETGLKLGNDDLSLFGYVSERGYESSTNWLMFLFDCNKPITRIPDNFDEGTFRFFSRSAISSLNIPPSDHELIWPFYDKRNLGFWCIQADCDSQNPPKLRIEAFPG